MKIRILAVTTVCLAVSGLVTQQSSGQSSGTENLYAQYYTPPGASIADAEMYPAPHPVPRHVGGTYNTYQPLMPHELMYTHSRNYYNFHAAPDAFYSNMCGGASYRPGYGVTKTSVRWQNGCSHIAPLAGTMVPFSRVAYRLNGLHGVRPPRVGLLGGLCGRASGCGVATGCLDGNCSGGGAGFSSGLDADGGCDNCESYADNWQQAGQQSAARTAESMSNRTNR